MINKNILKEKNELWQKVKEKVEIHSYHTNRELIKFFIEELFSLFYPSGQDLLEIGERFELRYQKINYIFNEIISGDKTNDCCDLSRAEEIFYKHLPLLYDYLQEDAEATLNSDPAAHSLSEVIHSYPGFYAIFIYRVAHLLNCLHYYQLARMISEYGHSTTGIDIHPAATIGRSFSIDHGTGIVIGGTAVIGNNVKMYHGVTLGATVVEKDMAGVKRHPTIEDNVTIYSGATILGGKTIIGCNSVIGGNVFLTKSVPANSVIYIKNDYLMKERDTVCLPEGLSSN